MSWKWDNWTYSLRNCRMIAIHMDTLLPEFELNASFCKTSKKLIGLIGNNEKRTNEEHNSVQVQGTIHDQLIYLMMSKMITLIAKLSM